MHLQPAVLELLNNASQLKTNDFDLFFKEMLWLRARRVAPVLSKKETDLLEKIYQKLPLETRGRYQFLTEKRQAEKISEAEYQELLTMVQVVENHNVQRLQAIIDLANFRKVSAQELMLQLKIFPMHHG